MGENEFMIMKVKIPHGSWWQAGEAMNVASGWMQSSFIDMIQENSRVYAHVSLCMCMSVWLYVWNASWRSCGEPLVM
jgi:hypothetical protein